MNPGEAQRKLTKLEEEHEETLRELAVYKAFYDASLAMNVAASNLVEAKQVRECVNACETYKIRKGVEPPKKESALDALKKWKFEPSSEESTGTVEFQFQPSE